MRMISFVIEFTMDTIYFNISEVFGNLLNRSRHHVTFSSFYASGTKEKCE